MSDPFVVIMNNDISLNQESQKGQSRFLILILVFNATFNNISAISWRPVLVVEEAGEPPTMGKQLVNYCGCESSAPFFAIYKAGREHMRYW